MDTREASDKIERKSRDKAIVSQDPSKMKGHIKLRNNNNSYNNNKTTAVKTHGIENEQDAK